MSRDRPDATGQADAHGRFAVVAARFNAPVVDRLLEAAVETLRRHGIDEEHVTVARVPGAFELPQAVRRLADSARFDAVIALGAVIRGGTPHFDLVCRACTDGLMQVSLSADCAVAFGVLTTDDEGQAHERAGGAHGNKGEEAALAALEMVAFNRETRPTL